MTKSKRKSGPALIKCVICSQECQSQLHLVTHFMALHKGEEYQCVYCGKMFDQESLLSEHLEVVHQESRDQQTSEWPGTEDVGYDDEMFDADAVEIKKEVDAKAEDFSDEDEILAHRKSRKRPTARKRKLVVEPSEVAVKLETVDDVDDVGAVAESPNVSAGVHPCDQCDEVFGTWQGLAVHVKRQHRSDAPSDDDDNGNDQATMTCEICGEEFPVGVIYSHHVVVTKSPDGQDIFTCDVCKKIYSSKKNCTHHIRSTHSKNYAEVKKSIEATKKFKCQQCNVRFSTAAGRMKHVQLVHKRSSSPPKVPPSKNPNPVTCQICDEIVLGSCIYSHHIISNDDDDDPAFTCNVCMEKMPFKQTCSKHIRESHLSSQERIDEARASFSSGFFCNICQKSMSREDKFNHHIDADFEKSNFVCTVCDRKFERFDDCQSHLSIEHYNLAGISKMDTFHCKTCDKPVLESERYSHHTELIDRTDKSGATVTVFACNICHKEFTANTYLKLHLVNHLSEPKRLDKLTFFCKICKQTVTSHDTLSHHIIVTKDDQNRPIYICDVCKKTYDKIRNVRAHLSGFHVMEMCETCGKDVNAGSLKKHQMTHSAAPPSCTECKEIFKDVAVYRQHMAEKHSVFIKNKREDLPSWKKTHLCDLCGKWFRYRADLKEHARTNHVTQLCTICNMQVTSLAKHQKKKHLKELGVKCSVCGILCLTQEKLDKHKQMKHSGQNIFDCKYCEQMFPSKIKRIEHMAETHGLKHVLDALKCDICNKIMTSASSKWKHMDTVHAGKKRWACDQCDKAFTVSATLKAHIDRVHINPPANPPVRNYPCPHCGKGLVNSSRLKYHINRFHSDAAEHQPPQQQQQQLQQQRRRHLDEQESVKNESIPPELHPSSYYGTYTY